MIAVSHTYTQNGDLMRDPEMTFQVDREKGTLEPLTFRQDALSNSIRRSTRNPASGFPSCAVI